MHNSTGIQNFFNMTELLDSKWQVTGKKLTANINDCDTSLKEQSTDNSNY